MGIVPALRALAGASTVPLTAAVVAATTAAAAAAAAAPPPPTAVAAAPAVIEATEELALADTVTLYLVAAAAVDAVCGPMNTLLALEPAAAFVFELAGTGALV